MMTTGSNTPWRALWLLPFFALNTAVLGLLSVAVSIWSARGARRFAAVWAKLNMRAAGVRLVVEGLDHIGASGNGHGGVIVASNHGSAADIGAILAGLPLDICWVAKDSLLKIPFLGWHLNRVHIPIARKSVGGSQKFLELGARRIRDGASVTIFPEGTRNRGSEPLLPFKKGTFLLARASGRPVLPVAIIGAKDVWPPSAWVPRPGPITLRIGQPVDPVAFGESDLTRLADETRGRISALLAA